MFSKIILILILPKISFGTWFKGVTLDSEIYSTYTVEVENITLCKEYQLKSASKNTLKVVDKSTIIGNITVIQDIKTPIKEKIVLWSYKKTKLEKVFTFIQPNICLCGFCVDRLYSLFLNIKKSGNQCPVFKGTKTFEVDLDKYVHDYIGDKNLIGRHKARYVHFTARLYTICLDIILNSKKI